VAMNLEALFPPLAAVQLPVYSEIRERFRVTYDGPSDTLFLDFFGKGQPAASIPLDRGDRDYLYARVDPNTGQIVGVQIEEFLSYAVEVDPELLGAVSLAEFRGVAPEAEADLKRRSVRSATDRRDADAQSLLATVERLLT